MYDLGLYIWTVWTVRAVTVGGRNNRSIIQRRFYGRTSFIHFHFKGKIQKGNTYNHFLINSSYHSISNDVEHQIDIKIFQILRPRNMILTSLVTCIASAILLVVAGGDSKYGLYTGAGSNL